MPTDLPALAARDLLNELMRPTESVFGGFGLNEADAQKLIDAHAALVRAAALREATAALGAETFWFDPRDRQAAMETLRRVAATAPTSQES